MKRLFDLVVGALLMIVTAPIQLVTAWLIRIDSRGSAFFRQKRIGLDGRPFDMLKFRTMTYGADETAHLLHIQQLKAEGGEKLRMDEDDRITRVGHYLPGAASTPRTARDNWVGSDQRPGHHRAG